MSLLRRKPRPLAREVGTLRDDRLFIIACDDTYAPKQYFDFFKIARIQVHVIATNDGSSAASHVLNRLRNVDHEDDDERWLVLDTDHCIEGTHLKSFVEVLSQARQLGIKVALSRPCFELWLLLHTPGDVNTASYANAKDVEKDLRDKLGEYDKTNLKAEKFSLESVVAACQRAKLIDTDVVGGDIPGSNTTRVYQIWESIAGKALPSQLPPELKELLG